MCRMNRRTDRVVVHVSPGERRLLSLLAAREGVSLSTYARAALRRDRAAVADELFLNDERRDGGPGAAVTPPPEQERAERVPTG